MPIRKYKPTSPGRRDMSVADFSDLSRKRPERKLTKGLTKSGGRNNAGRVTSFHRGGGHKRRYRRIDFRREKHGVPAKVASIEYDPNRTCRIALLHYADGEKRYIPAPIGLSVGDTVMSGRGAEIQPGNALPLTDIPLGTVIHAVEMKPGKGAQMVRGPARARRHRGPRKHLAGHSRSGSLAGDASQRSRRGDESGRPSARRW
jgi:large subunit ribosomal protein L2